MRYIPTKILLLFLSLFMGEVMFAQTSKEIILERANFYLEQSNYYKNREERDLDSLSYYANKVLQLAKSNKFLEKQEIDAISNLALKVIVLKNIDQARIYIDQIKKKSLEINYGKGLSVAARYAAYIHRGENNINLFIHKLEQAYKISEEYEIADQDIFDAALDLSIGYLEYQYGTDLISKSLLDVIDLAEDPGITAKSKGIFYQNLASVYELNYENEKAIINYKKSIEMFSQVGDTFYLYHPLINLSSIYRRKGDFDQAISVLERALQLKRKISYGNIYFSMGLIYSDMENYKSSEEYLKKALIEYEAVNNYTRQGSCLKELGDVKLKTNDPKQSQIFYNRGIKKHKKAIVENKKNKVRKPEIGLSYLELSEINEHLDNYKESLENYKLYTVYQDSVNNARTLNVSERFTFFKEVTKKDKEIEILRNQNEIQNLKAKRQNYFKISLLFFSTLILLLFAVLLNRYRLKKKALKTIKEKNEENKLLVSEIHHRVKNNLQIISSLLGAQIYKHTDNDELKEILLESQNKIKSMAIIHQNLFSDEKFSRVSVRPYILELTDHIQGSLGKNVQSTKVQINLDVDAKNIQIGLAIPLGLILNELLTNCYKYAFEGIERKLNTIDIKFKQIENSSKFYLSVKDNGIGLPSDFDIDNLTSYGIQLVHGLVEQLNGKIKITTEAGTHYSIILREPV